MFGRKASPTGGTERETVLTCPHDIADTVSTNNMAWGPSEAERARYARNGLRSLHVRIATIVGAFGAAAKSLKQMAHEAYIERC